MNNTTSGMYKSRDQDMFFPQGTGIKKGKPAWWKLNDHSRKSHKSNFKTFFDSLYQVFIQFSVDANKIPHI